MTRRANKRHCEDLQQTPLQPRPARDIERVFERTPTVPGLRKPPSCTLGMFACRHLSNASVDDDLLRISRAIQTALREADRAR